MNKNKMIFALIAGLLFILLLWIVAIVRSSSDDKKPQVSTGDLRIWILEDSHSDFQNIVSAFKEIYPRYSSRSISVESFDNLNTYINTLNAAIVDEQAPDIFVVPNGANVNYENQILGIDPELVSPNDFRLRFYPVFGDDLITTLADDESVEFLKGIPAGYEALGILYNRKYFLQSSELSTWSNFLEQAQKITDKYDTIVPIALGNGSAVTHVADIINAFFVADGAEGLTSLTGPQIEQVLTTYNQFGDTRGDNKYNSLATPFVSNSDIEYFTQGDIAAMVGYPRDIEKIDSIGYQKNFLFATPFPKFVGEQSATSIRYQYFSINKDTQSLDMAEAFIQFLASSEGQQVYNDTFPYYLSPDTTIDSDLQEKKIYPNYNIVYKNFLLDGATKVSFDVGDRVTYEREVPRIADMDSEYDTAYSKLSRYIICSVTKQTTFLNLSSPCN